MIDIESAPEFYRGYLRKVKDRPVVENLMDSGDRWSDLIKGIPEEKGDYAYAEGKWTLKELILHVNDSERIFCYRALRFARNDKTDLAGFEEKLYAAESFASDRKISGLLNEFHILRGSSIDLFSSFNKYVMQREGLANDSPFSVETIGYLISGHCHHHADIITERYLNGD